MNDTHHHHHASDSVMIYTAGKQLLSIANHQEAFRLPVALAAASARASDRRRDHWHLINITGMISVASVAADMGRLHRVKFSSASRSVGNRLERRPGPGGKLSAGPGVGSESNPGHQPHRRSRVTSIGGVDRTVRPW